MPYIKRDDQKRLTNFSPDAPGEMNYLFTVIALEYLHKFGTSYKTINDVIGALEGAKLEFYRRVAGPYEDQKIKENGDIY